MPLGRKRSRNSTALVNVQKKRPIGKNLKSATIAYSYATQLNLDLYTCTYPATITGLRWTIGVRNNGATAAQGLWIIYRLKEGQGAFGISVNASIGNLTTPEQEVLATGLLVTSDSNVSGQGGTGPCTDKVMGETKSMRKLMGGDKIVFSFLGTHNASSGNQPATGVVSVLVQFFDKS